MEHITITPNYEHMFKTMLREAGIQGAALRMFDGRSDRAELMREVQRWFAPLTIAANSATTVEAIERLREAMSQMLKNLDTEAQRLESGDDAYANSPEGRKGLL
jgi:hypothetical protein